MLMSLEEHNKFCRGVFEMQSQKIAGMSGQEFLDKYDAGEYNDIEDDEEGRKISYLILLIPFGRR
jgi:hypothetical protein